MVLRFCFHNVISHSNFLALRFIDCLRESGEILATEEKSGTEKQGNSESTGNEVFKKVLHTPVVHLLGFIVLVYVGIEVTIGGVFTFFRILYETQWKRILIAW